VAGLVIAAATGPNQAEAALITDDASRFGQTVNPMLQQLFTAWHPGAAATNSSSASGTSGTASNGSSGPAPLHLYRAPDNTGTVGVPDGWKPQGQNGTFWVNKQWALKTWRLCCSICGSPRLIQTIRIKFGSGEVVSAAQVLANWSIPPTRILFRLFRPSSNIF